MMKTKLFMTLCALCTVALLASCERDTGLLPRNALLLTTEKYSGHSGAKVSVSDLSVQWVDGDRVNLNYAPYTVHVSGDKAYVVDDYLIGREVFGFSPASLNDIDPVEWNGATKQLTLTFPDHYTCSYAGGRQKLDLPMAAYSPSAADGIEFRHLSAAVKVLVKNTTTSDLTLDSVVVSSSAYRLSGSTTVTLSAGNAPSVGTEETAVSNSVTVSFSTPVTLRANEGNVVEVQVPVRPVGAGDLTIEVYAHRQGEAIGISGAPVVYKTVVSHFNHTAAAPALARNVMLTARVQIQSTTPTAEIDNSLFTINASGDKVRFSKGNLKQSGSVWSFHENQYDRSASQDDTERDLFQWSVVGTETMGAGWRALTAEEWHYLVTTRPGNRFAKACVAGVNGLILFPDSYVHPSGISLNHVNDASMGSGGSATYSSFNSFTAEQWARMEVAGAILLPAVHNNGGEGHYWSSTSDANNTAKRFYFSVGELFAANAEPTINTCSIRLVRSN
jgi:hypothetical protein